MNRIEGKTGVVEVEQRKGRGLGVQLTPGRVLEILGAYVPGVVGYKRLAREHGVTGPAVAAVVKGRTWRGVTGFAKAPAVAPRVKATR